jgi:hypothetical protein
MKFSIVSMKRGGQHAIINWIALNYGGEFLHFNCCHLNKGQIVPTCKSWVVYYDYNGKTTNYLKNKNYRKTLKEHSNVNNFIYNFEDYGVEIIEEYPVCKMKKVLILRDAFNMTASSLKHASNRNNSEKNYYIDNLEKRLDIWLNNAREFIRVESEFICVNYNTWVFNKSYRVKVAKSLGFINTDKGIDEVTDFGNGSSFDGLSLNSKESCLTRYPYLLQEGYFSRLLKYDKLEELDFINKKIFGIGIKDIK